MLFLILFTNYINEKTLWALKSRKYLFESIQSYAENIIENVYNKQKEALLKKETTELNKEEKEALSGFKNETVRLSEVKAIFFLAVCERLEMKSLTSILINPFIKTVEGTVKNKELLNLIINN